MAAITIVAGTVRCARRSNESQHTAPAAVAVLAGQAVRPDANAKWVLANATDAASVGDLFFAEIAVAINETLTAHKGPAVFDVGDSLSALAYGDAVYLGDTDGAITTTAGTVSTVIGRVTSGWAGSAKKLLRLTQS